MFKAIKMFAMYFAIVGALCFCSGQKSPQPMTTYEKMEVSSVADPVETAPSLQSELDQTSAKPTAVAALPNTSQTDGEKALSPTPDSPIFVIESYTAELRKIVEIEAKDKNAQSSKEEDIAKKVRQFFDFPELAKRSLGSYWATAPSAKRSKFSKLFIQLVEDSYLRRSRNLMANYDIVFKTEYESEKKSKVVSTISRDDANIDISYELWRNSANKWMIYNIILDDVDLIRNYQSQFNRIIQKDGFDHLISLMEKKVKSGPDETLL